MKKLKFLLPVLFFSAISAANAVEVKKELAVNADMAKVWKVAGEYCSIKEWSPSFSDCTQYMENGTIWRILTIKGNGLKVREKLTDVDDFSYDYAIIDAPLPLRNHQGKMWVEAGEKPGQSVLRWEVSFDVHGDAKKTKEVTQIIDGILTDGLKGIRDQAVKQ